jgi:signal transduction histidine kinase
MQDDFIAVLAHELRSPLNAMMSWTRVLMRQGGSEETMRILQAIERNGQTQAKLISDVLDIARLRAGTMRLTRLPLDLKACVQEAVASMAASLRDNGNELVLHLAPVLPRVDADVVRLQQVVCHLLANAIRFSPRESHIELELAAQQGGVRLAVRDHGRGIASELLPQLFDRFSGAPEQAGAAPAEHGAPRQAAATAANAAHVAKGARHASGLGLALVKQLVLAHGGRISASSDGVGGGATFEIWLPAAAPAGAP